MHSADTSPWRTPPLPWQTPPLPWQTPPRQAPPWADTSLQTTTAAGGTYPTGMYSCYDMLQNSTFNTKDVKLMRKVEKKLTSAPGRVEAILKTAAFPRSFCFL